jgi:phosphoribosylglycinamide formyltransferase-1
VILLQKTVPVHDDDTVETLSARILEQEHLAYPEAIARVLGGHYVIQGRRYVRLNPQEGQPLAIGDKQQS